MLRNLDFILFIDEYNFFFFFFFWCHSFLSSPFRMYFRLVNFGRRKWFSKSPHKYLKIGKNYFTIFISYSSRSLFILIKWKREILFSFFFLSWTKGPSRNHEILVKEKYCETTSGFLILLAKKFARGKKCSIILFQKINRWTTCSNFLSGFTKQKFAYFYSIYVEAKNSPIFEWWNSDLM